MTTPIQDPLVYVVTLTWNQKEDTLACLKSLSEMTYPNYRILLVDNGSIDGTTEAVREKFPDIEVIVNPQNLGFQGGFNVGLLHALERESEFILMINNDTYVSTDMLDVLVDHVHYKDMGILAPKIYYADEPNRIWSTGGNCHPWTLEMTNKGDRELDQGQWDEVLERDYLVGCALLLRSSLLRTVGLFDESYHPIYYEDVDLCMRARAAGFRLYLVPKATMWHKVSASAGGTNSPRERYLMARNSIRFFSKYTHGWRWLAVIPYRTVSAMKTVVTLMWQGRFNPAFSYLKGLYHGLKIAFVH
jgi:GT2 family glycosyltransferase